MIDWTRKKGVKKRNWLADEIIDWERLTERLGDWLIDRLIEWLVGWLIDWFIALLLYFWRSLPPSKKTCVQLENRFMVNGEDMSLIKRQPRHSTSGNTHAKLKLIPEKIFSTCLNQWITPPPPPPLQSPILWTVHHLQRVVVARITTPIIKCCCKQRKPDSSN